MAFAKRLIPGQFPAAGASLLIDEAPSKVAQANVMSGGATIYSIQIDCTENTAEAVYLKIKNATAIASVSACQPDHQYYCSAGDKQQYSMPEGLACSVGISYYVTTEAGVGGDTNPTGRVKIHMVLNS